VFSAAHAIRIGDHMEPVHGHNWTVRATVAGRQLDRDGLLVDFHRIERDLDAIIAPLHNRSLSETALFKSLNPTAEHVAREIGQALARKLSAGITLTSLSVGEAPGCTATWRPS
jgi:6-pyruvoyltetrahydropterin/6-carboxytetrahydropterin synthase